MINVLLWTLLFDYFPPNSQISILTHPQILMLHMGSTMGGFLRTLWWIVLFFYLFCAEIWRMNCLENRCYCKEELRLIDCSRAKLKAIPKSVPLVNYTTLNLRHNLLVQANVSVLEEQLPNFKMVDLRDNPFDCKGFPDKTILGVITDCGITKAVSVKTTTTTKVARTTLKANSRQPTTTTNILSSQDLDPVTSIIIYLPVLISTFVVMLVLIVCLNWSAQGHFRFPMSWVFLMLIARNM